MASPPHQQQIDLPRNEWGQDPLERIRNDFMDLVLREEKEKEQALKLQQANCFHNYNLLGSTYTHGREVYQERTCSKCGHAFIRSVKVWEGTKRGNCIIA